MADHFQQFEECFAMKAIVHMYPGVTREMVNAHPRGDTLLYSTYADFTYFPEICVVCEGPGVLYNLVCIIPHYVCHKCLLYWPDACSVCRRFFHPQMQIAEQSAGKNQLIHIIARNVIFFKF